MTKFPLAAADRDDASPNPVVSLDPSNPLEPRPLIADILRTRYCVPGSVFLVESVERCIPIPSPDPDEEEEDGHGGDGSEGAAAEQRRRRRRRQPGPPERAVRLLLGDGELCIQAFVRGEIHGFVDGGSVYEGCYVRLDRFWLGEEPVGEEELDDGVGDPEVLERQTEKRRSAAKGGPVGRGRGRCIWSWAIWLRGEGVVSPTEATGNHGDERTGEQETGEFEDEEDDEIIERLMDVEKGGQAGSAVTPGGLQTPGAVSAKPSSGERPEESDYGSDSDSAFETLAVSPKRASQRRIAVATPADPREELEAAIIKQNQERRGETERPGHLQPRTHQPQPQPQPQPQQPKPQAVANPRPWLPTDATQLVKLTALSQVPHLPYRQNWMVNVLAVVTSLSDVEPSYIGPSFRQRTARLSDMSTPKQVLLSVYLDPEEFTPAEGSVVLLLGVKNHQFDGGSLRKYVSDRLPSGQSCAIPARRQGEMAKDHNKRTIVTVEAVVGVAELGMLIFGFLCDISDLRNAALVSKRLYNAAQPYLWTAIAIPYLHPPPGSRGRHAFWDRFSSFLGRHTLSLRADMQTMAPDLSKTFTAGGRSWESGGTSSNLSVLKRDVDELFRGLEETLARAGRLRSFSARDVPRVLDLLVLLQRHRAEIQCVSITASECDTFGLLPLPAHDAPHWRQKVWLKKGLVVPLANSVNLGLDINVAPVFSFPNLRALSLNNLQYDNRCPSPYFDNLVAVIKGSPGLLYLELSLRHAIGGLSLDGSFCPQMYGIPKYGLRTDPNHAMRSLCLQYHKAGGKPLRLRVLTLGYGFEMADNDVNGAITPAGVAHYLAYLTNLKALEGLHLEGIHDKNNSHLCRLSDALGLPLISSASAPHSRCLAGLRKATWPWKEGYLLQHLADGYEQHLRELVLRIDAPSPRDWAEAEGGRRTWVVPERLQLASGAAAAGPLLRGLVLPTESMSPQDGRAFLAGFPAPWLEALESLKIRMPPLVAGDEAWSGMRDLRDRLVRMRRLRHLWLADGSSGSSSSNQQHKAAAAAAAERYPSARWFRALSAAIAARWCPQLAYLRILDRAWHVAVEDRYVVLREVPRDRVDADVPDDFDFRKPEELPVGERRW
ncbi:hypothetical protein VTH06DRAFT_1813 [Thermothelomyces fergusii]